MKEADIDLIESEEEARWDPEMIAWFENHHRRWANHEIRLIDFCESFEERDGVRYPVWYAKPLCDKMQIDKAVFFEKIDYWPSEPACRAHASLAHIKYFSGGARAGKSLWGAMEVAPILLTPGTQGWILGPEYGNTVKEFRYLKAATIDNKNVRAVLERSGARVIKETDRPEQGEMEIRIAWPGLEDSWVRCKSSKTLAALLSEELDFVIMCEAALIRKDIWENKIRMRLTDRHGLALFPSSPAGTGWTKDLMDKGLDGTPGHFAISADTRTNPIADLDSVRFWSKDMSHADFEEQVRGKPTPKHGLVFPQFDADVHVRSYRTDWPQPKGAIRRKGWNRCRAMDFGYQDPHVTLWAAFDEDRRVYVYREFYRVRTLVDEICEHISKVEGRSCYRDSKGRVRVSGIVGSKDPVKGPTVTDWDAQMRAELGQRGIRCRRANKDVAAGITTFAAHLKVQRDGRPRLFIHPSCKNLIRELRNYEWSRDGGDKPQDGDDHAVDACRYLLHTLRAAGRKRMAGSIG